MLSVLKWIYKLGVDASRRSIICELESRMNFHRMQGEIAYYRETNDPNSNIDKQPRMSSDEHRVAADTISNLLTQIEPVNHPSIEEYLRKVM